MHGYIERSADSLVAKNLAQSPGVAILGPRQCGKSTLAKQHLQRNESIYLDLQARGDLAKLSEPELFFDEHHLQLVCLGEIQRIPEFFSILRSEVDRDRRPGRFLILGSASRDLIRQSNESLAGRISFIELTPFQWPEVSVKCSLAQLWNRGEFP